MNPVICPVCQCEVDQLLDYYGSKMCDLCLEDKVLEDQINEQEEHDAKKYED